jgi:hypothetical protein
MTRFGNAGVGYILSGAFMSQWSPLSTAVVFCIAASVPAPGFGQTEGADFFNLYAASQILFFCSSVPYSFIGQKQREQ